MIEDAMKKTLLLIAVLALGACREETTGGAVPPGFDNFAMTAAERADCMARGGTVGRGGMSPAEICIVPTKDGGKSCTRASDCDGHCLAQTKTCSKTEPTFGCFGTLTESGERADLCVD
jgi:hypothetical protein